MENERSRTECQYCMDFVRYYTLGVKKFDQTKVGWCGKKQEMVRNCDACKNFVCRPYIKKCRYSLKHALNGLLAEISEIRKVLESDNDLY